MSLVARHLEANAIPTVVVGAARDIVEECGVARFLFSDVPLGTPCGRREITGLALGLLESATLPRTTVQTPYVWSDDASWKDAYARIDPEHAEALRRAGEVRRARQQQARLEGRTRTS